MRVWRGGGQHHVHRHACRHGGPSFGLPGSSGGNGTGGVPSGSDPYAPGTCSGIVVANNTYQSLTKGR